MPSFKDQDARDWELPLDALAILKIREDCDPRFMLGDESEEDNTCLRLEDDPILLCRVLYLLCDKQRADRSVSEADFYLKVLGDGDTIQAAGEAMVATIINFIQPRKRKWIEAVVAKQKAVEDLVIAKALAKMDNPELISRMEKAIDMQMDAAIEKSLTQLENASDSPASAASTPAA